MKVALMIAAVLLPMVSAGLLGSEEAVSLDVGDKQVVFATSAINSFLAEKFNEAPQEAKEVISATRQMVAGVLYRIKIRMSNNRVCDIKVLEQLWMDPQYTQTGIKCQEQLRGGEQEVTFDREDVQKALQLVTKQFNMMSNSRNLVIPTGGKVTLQVVKGFIYRFKNMEMKVTTCEKNDENMGKFTAEECPLDETSNSSHGTINAEVYLEAVTNKLTINNLDIMRKD